MAEAVRMTKGLAEDIARAAVSKTFEARKKELEKLAADIILRGYKSIMTKDLIKKVDALPNELKKTRSQIYLRIDGQWASQKFEGQEFLLPWGWDNICYVKDEAIIKEWHAYVAALEEHKKSRSTAEHRLTVLLQSCSNFNKVAELWPDGKPFYENYLVPQTRSGLPAICFDDVNKALGLTKKGEKK